MGTANRLDRLITQQEKGFKFMTYPVFEYANANFVTQYLAVGGDLDEDESAAGLQAFELVDEGITHILDARFEASDNDVWDQIPIIDYLWNGIDDAGQQVPSSWFEDITTWATEAIRQGGKVLTHCHMGINRGPSAGFAVLLAMGWDPVEALTAIRAARSIAHIAYAEDALEWHLKRNSATANVRRASRADLVQWRHDNPLDVLRVIRSVRRGEAA